MQVVASDTIMCASAVLCSSQPYKFYSICTIVVMAATWLVVCFTDTGTNAPLPQVVVLPTATCTGANATHILKQHALCGGAAARCIDVYGFYNDHSQRCTGNEGLMSYEETHMPAEVPVFKIHLL